MTNYSAVLFLLNNNNKDIYNFRKAISLFINNYYNYFPCDIICLHEKDFPLTEIHFLKNNLIDINIFFHEIQFQIPNYSRNILDNIPLYYQHPDFPQAQGFSLGYRHMCRFFAGAMFDNEILLKYKFIWRLDTDSFILSPIKYDVFQKMNNNNYIYGYINIQHDHPGVIKNLWEISKDYFTSINKNHIFNFPNINFHKNRVFYTNFEIMNIEWFAKNNSEYKNYFNFIDKSAGIYLHRWGDHSIRYIGVNSLVNSEQIHFFDDIDYFHQKHYFNNKITNTFNVN